MKKTGFNQKLDILKSKVNRIDLLAHIEHIEIKDHYLDLGVN